MTDQYERVDAQGDGIGREGAIVYEVENTNNVFLRTTIALRVGQSCSNVDEGFKVEVLQDIVGGYQVRITRSQTNTCPQLLSRIQALQTQYDHTTDNDLR